ncbi:MAG: dihydropteroate synthase [Pseudomonadota bacterium]
MPVVMGVLNVTPDSFSDGGHFFDAPRAVDHAHAMVEAGAAIIDVGGESTRPGARPVPVDEEIRRVVPVVQALAADISVPVSVDTTKPEVMEAAIDAGAGLINDVNALRTPGAVAVAAAGRINVCLMHMQGEPRTMQDAPHYDDVVSDVRDYLVDRATRCETAGIERSRIVLDPGFGFGKTADHNLALLAGLDALSDCGYPVLAGLSRKATIRALTGRDAQNCLPGSLAAAVLAAARGASIIRAHDVAETVDALKVTGAVNAAGRDTSA